MTAHVERVMPLQFTSYTYATLSEASSPPSAGITAAHVAGGKPDHTQGGAVRCARPLGRGRLGPGPPHSVQHLPITRLKEGPEGGGSCAPSTGQPSWSMPLLPPPAAPTPYLEMGAGHTASHLLEEGLLDLHKLGGLDDVQNLFHLPQEHHLQAGGGGALGSVAPPPRHAPRRPPEAQLPRLPLVLGQARRTPPSACRFSASI